MFGLTKKVPVSRGDIAAGGASVSLAIVVIKHGSSVGAALAAGRMLIANTSAIAHSAGMIQRMVSSMSRWITDPPSL